VSELANAPMSILLPPERTGVAAVARESNRCSVSVPLMLNDSGSNAQESKNLVVPYLNSSLCNLCVLCVSVVKNRKGYHHSDKKRVCTEKSQPKIHRT